MAKKIAAVIAPGDQEVVYEGASTFMFQASKYQFHSMNTKDFLITQ
jgi:hypothetical protein